MKLSARNQIPARVTTINAGEAIANVELDANGVRLVASTTVEAVRELGLTEGSNVTAVIKASDVMVATAASAARQTETPGPVTGVHLAQGPLTAPDPATCRGCSRPR